MAQAEQADLRFLFPTVVQVRDVDNAAALNDELVAAIKDVRRTQPNTKPQSWACDLYTTIGAPGSLFRHSGFTRFLEIARKQVLEFAKTLSFDTDRHAPEISECWVNAYGNQQAQEIHLHRNSVISGVYYVRAPEGAGATLFYSPSADVMLEPRALESNPLTAKVTGFPPVEGRMLLFRSHLRHSVMPGVFEGERITLAFNATV